MSFYKIHLEYKGTNYQGFQIQNDVKTIQGELNTALKLISKSEEIKSIGSGRTDAGVHAFDQVVRIEIPLDINPQNLVRAINTKLPPDIRVKGASHTNSEFHPIFSAKSKEYNYVFTTKEIPSVFGRELMSTFDFDFDTEILKQAANRFVGEFDFINYQCTGTDIENTVRKITKCEVIRHVSTGHWGSICDEYYIVRVVGNGFLKQMVRLMIGAIWNAARGKITLDLIDQSLLEPMTKRLGAVAPPEGLYLKEVHY